MPLVKINDMIDTKISVGTIGVVAINICAAAVYVMVNLNTIGDLSKKVDTLLKAQADMALAIPLQNRDIKEDERNIAKLQNDQEHLFNRLGVIETSVSNLNIVLSNIQSRFDDVLQASGSKSKIRMPKGND